VTSLLAALSGHGAATGVFLPRGAIRLLAEEGAEHAGRVLGIPEWIWQLANLVLFLGVLIYFVARPLTEAFRKRQVAVEKRLLEAKEKRAEAERFEREISERMNKLESDLEEVRRRGREDGEAARSELEQRARDEAERIRKDAEAEIERRVAAAKAELRREAANLTASAAQEIVAREMTDEDRRRLLTESVSRLKEVQ